MSGERQDKTRETLCIIDGSSVFYRAYHAVPSNFKSTSGMPTNAVYGFTQTLRKILKDFSPKYIAVAFDVKGPSFRHEMFTGYKAERPAMPDELSVQIPYIKKVVKAFNIPAIEMVSFEADDVIATLAMKFVKKGLRVAMVTGDKDMFQLIDENIFILDYNSGKECGPREVVEKFGVIPVLIRDMLGLAGDTSDNIPGVPGIGYKTAAKLLSKYGNLEKIYENLEDISGDKLRENLKTHKDQAFLSRELATLHPQVPVECSLEEMEYKGPDHASLEALLRELDFRRILAEVVAEKPGVTEEDLEFEEITDGMAVVSALKGAHRIAITLVRHIDDQISSDMPVSIGMCIDNDKTYHLRFVPPSKEGVIPGPEGLDMMTALRPYLEDPDLRKDTDDAKSLYLFFGSCSVDLAGVEVDTSLASYLLDPSRSDHSVEALAFEYLGANPSEPVKHGLDDPKAKLLLAGKARNIAGLAKMLHEELEKNGLLGLYTTMELPLSRVLASMERFGIKVDAGMLRDLSKEIEIDLAGIEGRIYAGAGTTFNINSPKQLSEILFERLGLKPVKKTKTGFSTNEEVLTALASQHEVPSLIIGFRQLFKLKSTYVDAILEIINPATGRVHTSFNQTVTATGRLSSSRPNLQNIPARGDAALRIREAFIPEEGFFFLCADYSQIELRIVAHISEDPVLVEAFKSGEDVHTRTASEVFGIMPGLVTSELRRRAKAINFGIIYGMGPYGLSTELGISVKEATEYIERYLERYKGVKEFMERCVSEAAKTGYTMTLFGRRRFIPELKSAVDATYRFGQRLAINTPIQGTAADMIKAAMINIDKRLVNEGFRSRMLLQIHDELVFEAALEEKDLLSSMVRSEMEGILPLHVPVVVNLKSGPDWRSVE
ncbi:MAG: DNA polymerase I [Deltaproteobacteria bacterium]